MRHLDGVEQVLALYPYVVEGGFTVVSKSPDTGLYDAHFGMIMTNHPEVCHAGYESHRPPAAPGRREPADERGRTLRRAAHPVQRPRRPERARSALRRRRSVASYDPAIGDLRLGHPRSRVTFRRLARWHQEPWEGIRGSGCSCSP